MRATEGYELATMSVEALFEAAASTNPTPGGGCVSAVGGYLGISLLLKAIRISARKREDAAFSSAEGSLSLLGARLLALGKDDSESFGLYIKALQLPKRSVDDMRRRTEALAEASLAATNVAVAIIEAGLEVLECAALVYAKVSPSIMADATACIQFTCAMMAVARENALANLGGIIQSTVRTDIEARLCAANNRQAALVAACKPAA